MEFKIAGGGAAEVGGGAAPTDDLIRRRVPDRTACLHLGQKLRLVGQRLNPCGDGIAGGVVAGGDQKAKEVAELMFGHDRAIRTGLQDKMQDARGVARGFLLTQKLFGIDKQLGPGGGVEGHHSEFVGGHLVQHMLGKVGIRVGDQRVALFDQPRQVSVRRAKDTAQHPHRQLTGDVLGGVEGAFLQRLVQNRAAQFADDRFELGDHRFGKGLGHLDPGLHMLRRVGFLKGAAGEVFLIGLILHPDAAGRGHKIRLAVEEQDVLMPGDRPIALSARPVRPMHRVFVAQALEGVVRGPRKKAVMAAKVGMARVGRGPDGHVAFPCCNADLKIY